MAYNEEYKFCMFPVRQVKQGETKWVKLSGTGEPDYSLTVTNPDNSDSNFLSGFMIVLDEQMRENADKFPGTRAEVYIERDGTRAKEKSLVKLIPEKDVRRCCKLMAEMALNDPECPELTDWFQAIRRLTIGTLYEKGAFGYWKQLVGRCYISYAIKTGIYEDQEQYDGHRWHYFFTDRHPNALEGIREVGANMRTRTNGHLNEKKVKEFLMSVNPLECGRYVCGIKVSDRSFAWNGGIDGGYNAIFLYDADAIYHDMTKNM